MTPLRVAAVALSLTAIAVGASIVGLALLATSVERRITAAEGTWDE